MVEAKTQQPVQFYGHLVQSVAAGVLVLDEQGVVISADQVAAATLEYELDALIGCRRQMFWPEDATATNQLPEKGSPH
ncbi:MAG TPA: PAS domain-containing protein, partial [Anaerolineae bacterium]